MKTSPRNWLFLFLIAALVMSCRAVSPVPNSPTGQPATAVVQPTLPAETPASPEASPTAPVPQANLQVIYIKNGNLWRWMEGNPPQQVTQSGQVTSLEISDDGRMVAFTRNTDEFHSELWAVDSDGSNERVLVTSAQLDALELPNRDPNTVAVVPHRYQWVPGAHLVVFNTQQLFQGPGQFLSDDLRQVDPETLDLTTLLPPGRGGEFYYSPDGRQIAIVTPRSISLINADGSNLRENVLQYELVMTFSEYLYYARPVWSSDSTYLRVVIPPVDAMAQPAQPTTIYHIPVDGSPAQAISQVTAAPFFGGEVALSPDLSRILFLRETGAPEQNLREIYIANADGTNEVLFDTAPMLQLRGWAWDSEHFMYFAGDSEQTFLADVGGSKQPLLSGMRGIFEIRWIDSTRFLHLAEGNGVLELRISGLDGASFVIDAPLGQPAGYDFDI